MEIDIATGAAVLTIVSRKHGTFRVLIDPEDWQRVRRHTWSVLIKHKDYLGHGRVYFTTKNRDGRASKRKIVHVYLHRFIMGDPEGLMVDHRDPSATLDNRKQNLRVATNGQNNYNTRKRKTPTSSWFKGVAFRKDTGRWRAYVNHDGLRKYLGDFPTTPDGEIAAARAYDCAARQLHGEFALLNFPKSPATDCAQIAA